MSLLHRPLGGPRNTIQDSRPPQLPPAVDTSVIFHDCHDQQSGEPKPDDCGCKRGSKLDAAALIKHGKADPLVFARNGKVEKSKTSIVLRREYVTERLLKSTVDPSLLLPAILKSGSILSFRKDTIRAANGAAIVLEIERTDAHYWNSVLVVLGIGEESGKYLKNAAAGMGTTADFTKLENWEIAPFKRGQRDEYGRPLIDPAIENVIGDTLEERATEVKRRRHKVGAANFRKGSGGLTYGVEGGKTKKLKPIYSVGASRDSDERFGEAHDTTGQMNSDRDSNYSGAKGFGPEGAPLGNAENPYRSVDNRTLPDPLLKHDAVQKEIDKAEAKSVRQKYSPVYDADTTTAKTRLDEPVTDDVPENPHNPT